MCTGFRLGKFCMLTAVAALFSMVSAQQLVDATVPVKVNVAANVVFAPITGVSGTGAEGAVTANAEKNFNIKLSTGYDPGPSSASYLPSGRANAGAQARYSRGNINLNLPAQSYKNAVISLYSVNGKRILSGNASASKAQTFSISRANVPAGVYLLSAKGANGNSFATRLTHIGGRLNINAAFSGMDNAALNKSAAAGDYGRWTITVSANGYFPETRTFSPDAGTNNPLQSFELKPPAANNKANFTETVGNLTFDMIYVPGGTFTIGCTASSGCPSDAKPVEGVKVSSYYIGKTEVTTALWNAVMGVAPCVSGPGVYCPSTSGSYTNMTWYDAMEFACKLGQLTGRNYRMPTEAEWEYAAKNHLSSLEKIGSGEEWAYNSWLGTHAGGEDPVGPGSGLYTQKTRRDAKGIGTNDDASITGRLIRSVEGKGPALRLAISADTDYPPTYVQPCYLHMPAMGAEPENSYRDSRWVTGDDAQWAPSGSIAIGSFKFRLWEDGTAERTDTSYYPAGYTYTSGQWFTSNNIALVFVPSSGSSGNTKFGYIFLDESQGSVISDKGFMSGGYIGRIEKKPVIGSRAKPVISGLKTGAELAAAAGDDYKMWDMANIPADAKKQDLRLLDGPDSGWFQDNTNNGGVHHYRKDVDLDEFRFTVNQGGGRTMLANGSWFTLNNTFLRVTHSTGYQVDYLYAVVKEVSYQNNRDTTLTFYHNSFMGYERGDFRMFTKKRNGGTWPCGSICNDEIPKNERVSFYDQADNGQSTFIPAPCPAGGCK